MGLIHNSNLRYIRAEDGDKVGIFMMQAIIKIDTDQIAEIGEFNLVDNVEVDQGMNKIIGEGISELNLRMYQNFERQNRGECRGNYRNENYNRERGRSRSMERPFSRNIDNRKNDRSISNTGSRTGSRASTNRDRIRCYKCRQYGHFMKDCPTSKEER